LPVSGRDSPYQTSAGQRLADNLEEQNDEALDGLSAKVKLLKDVSESLVFAPALCAGYLCCASFIVTAHNRHRKRSQRVDGPANPNGVFFSFLV
jgi:hypothetical protein